MYRYIKPNNGSQITSSLTSTYNFCERVRQILKDELGINSGVYESSKHNGITNYLSISKGGTKIFLDWLYEDANIFMERKHNRYLEYFYNVA